MRTPFLCRRTVLNCRLVPLIEGPVAVADDVVHEPGSGGPAGLAGRYHFGHFRLTPAAQSKRKDHPRSSQPARAARCARSRQSQPAGRAQSSTAASSDATRSSGGLGARRARPSPCRPEKTPRWSGHPIEQPVGLGVPPPGTYAVARRPPLDLQKSTQQTMITGWSYPAPSRHTSNITTYGVILLGDTPWRYEKLRAGLLGWAERWEGPRKARRQGRGGGRPCQLWAQLAGPGPRFARARPRALASRM